MTLISLRNSAQLISLHAMISIEESEPGVVTAYTRLRRPTLIVKRQPSPHPWDGDWTATIDLVQFDTEARMEAYLCEICGNPEIEIVAQFSPDN